DNQVELYVEAYPYELLPNSRDQWDKIPTDTMRGCIEWLKVKAWELVRLAQIHEQFLGCGCPWCDHMTPAGEMLNVLLEHVALEPGPIQSVTLGDGVTVTMADGRTGQIRDVTDLTH